MPSAVNSPYLICYGTSVMEQGNNTVGSTSTLHRLYSNSQGGDDLRYGQGLMFHSDSH